jgi:hypothetical protein
MDELDYIIMIGIISLSIVVYYMVVVCVFTPFL